MITINKRHATSKNIIILAFIAFIIVPMLLLTYFILNKSTTTIKTTVATHTGEMLDEMSVIVEKETEKVESFLSMITYNTTIQEGIQSLETATQIEQNRIFPRMGAVIKNATPKGITVRDLLLVSANKGFYYYNQKLYIEESELRGSSWYKEAVNSSSKTVWKALSSNQTSISTNGNLFTVYKRVVDETSFRTIGYMYITFEDSFFKSILSNSAADEQIYVLDENRNILLSSDSKDLGNSFDAISNTPLPTIRGSFEQMFEGSKQLVVYSKTNQFGWKIVKKLPVSKLSDGISKIWSFAILLLIFCMIAFACYIIIMHRKITRPLQAMVNLINQIEADQDLNIRLDKYPVYELVTIQSEFLTLVNKSKKSTNELRISEVRQRKTELEKIQAEINPHFLYNTLNSIKYLALSSDQKQIATLITSLIKLLKNSINRDGYFITLKQEIENVSHYMKIENVIYNNNIRFEFDLDEQLDETIVPNFILQPLVENAIFHGIDPSEGDGVIRIRTIRKDDILIVEVHDNGVGMDMTRADLLLNKGNRGNETFSNLGMKGINEKIKLIYGQEYGLTVESVINQSTTVKLTIPIGGEHDDQSAAG